jgi:hypothetical protein
LAGGGRCAVVQMAALAVEERGRLGFGISRLPQGSRKQIVVSA